jgi:hypothetical protein
MAGIGGTAAWTSLETQVECLDNGAKIGSSSSSSSSKEEAQASRMSGRRAMLALLPQLQESQVPRLCGAGVA